MPSELLEEEAKEELTALAEEIKTLSLIHI